MGPRGGGFTATSQGVTVRTKSGLVGRRGGAMTGGAYKAVCSLRREHNRSTSPPTLSFFLSLSFSSSLFSLTF